MGENRPFVNNSRITETADPVNPTVIKTYEYKDVGITLNITPHVSQGGMVRLEIDSEFTKLITDVHHGVVRYADHGQAQGPDRGLHAERLHRGDRRPDPRRQGDHGEEGPAGRRPALAGRLFRYKADQVQKTNLLIFITPHVMETQEQMDEMTHQKRQQTLSPSAQDAAPAPSKKPSSRDRSR